MALVTVPCTPNGDSSWSQVTALDGASFTLTFRWSQRDGHWLLDLADAEGAPIRSGMLLAAGSTPLGNSLHPRRPRGELVVVDTTGKDDLDPGFSDLGTRFLLVYVEESSLA